MNYSLITTYYRIDNEAFKSIWNRIDIESNCDLKTLNRIVRFLTIPSPNGQDRLRGIAPDTMLLSQMLPNNILCSPSLYSSLERINNMDDK